MTSTPSPQPTTPPSPGWKRPCRIGWFVMRYFWGTIVVGLLLNAFVSLAFLSRGAALQSLYGLDEVEASARRTCIKYINTYRKDQHHLVPLVVCSRSQEYLTQEQRLTLPYAVEVQPFVPQQVDDYLKRVGKPVVAVRGALRSNPVLHDLVTTPLMLNVVMLAYRGKTAKDLPQLGTPEEQQRRD